MQVVIVAKNQGNGPINQIKSDTKNFKHSNGTNYIVVDEPIVKIESEIDKGKSEHKIWNQPIIDDYFSSQPGWVKWVTYKFKESIDTTRIDHLGYAYYCGGFLFYYDEIVRNGSVNHKITFHWSHHPGQKRLSIFISPGPNVDKKRYPHLHGTDEPQEYYHRDEAHDEYLLPRSGGIDPQPPPPPPPPPQEL